MVENLITITFEAGFAQTFVTESSHVMKQQDKLAERAIRDSGATKIHFESHAFSLATPTMTFSSTEYTLRTKDRLKCSYSLFLFQEYFSLIETKINSLLRYSVNFECNI